MHTAHELSTYKPPRKVVRLKKEERKEQKEEKEGFYHRFLLTSIALNSFNDIILPQTEHLISTLLVFTMTLGAVLDNKC